MQSPGWRATLLDGLGRAMRDQRGVSALEFALLIPIMIGFYVSAIELSTALTINRRTAAIAGAAADLVAQDKTTSATALRDVMQAASSILTPYPDAPLTIKLTSVVADSNNQGKVAWSCANKGGAYAAQANFPLPNGLTEAGSSVIVAEVKYAYTPLLGLTSFGSPTAFTMTRDFYSRPRKSLKVDKTDSGC